MIEIDGSIGEGGGQVLRTAVSLSAITGQATRIASIRAGRSRPGLQPQHLAAVRAAAQLCDAELEGDAIGSQRLVYHPRKGPGSPNSEKAIEVDIGTAGSVSLLAQTLIVPLLLGDARARVALTGGTHVPHAPTIDFLDSVYLLALARFGGDATVAVERFGFFPKGGGRIVAGVKGGTTLVATRFVERETLRSLRAIVATSGLPDHVAERGLATCRKLLSGFGPPMALLSEQLESSGPGAAVTIAAECEEGFAGFSSLGQRGKPMERVAEEACRDFRRWWDSGAAVDEHLADQLALPAALAVGTSVWTTPKVTEHLRTVIQVIESFLPVKFQVQEGMPARITVTGAGWQRLPGEGA